MTGSGPNVVVIDVETSPAKVYAWGLFNQNVGLNQVIEPGRIICFAAKRVGSKEVTFVSEHHDSRKEMLEELWRILDDADIVIGYNSKAFDTKIILGELAAAGFDPPSPFQQIDLLGVVKRNFRLLSHKLDNVAHVMLDERKVDTGGFSLWRDCLDGDDKAWRKMRKYNIEDVRITERLYLRIRPWITDHPHVGLWNGNLEGCPKCGSTERQSRGYRHTLTGTFRQYQCTKCRGWYQNTRSVERASTRNATNR